MKDIDLRSFTADTELTNYMPIPRQVLGMGLPSTAVLIYAALLDRATLSRKNRYMEDGEIYVLYAVESLAEVFSISTSAVKRSFRELENKGLIRRDRKKKNGPNHIFLLLPEDSGRGSQPEQKCTSGGSKKSAATGQKRTPNNKNKQQEYINYYQHGEDESL